MRFRVLPGYGQTTVEVIEGDDDRVVSSRTFRTEDTRALLKYVKELLNSEPKK